MTLSLDQTLIRDLIIYMDKFPLNRALHAKRGHSSGHVVLYLLECALVRIPF